MLCFKKKHAGESSRHGTLFARHRILAVLDA